MAGLSLLLVYSVRTKHLSWLNSDGVDVKNIFSTNGYQTTVILWITDLIFVPITWKFIVTGISTSLTGLSTVTTFISSLFIYKYWTKEGSIHKEFCKLGIPSSFPESLHLFHSLSDPHAPDMLHTLTVTVIVYIVFQMHLCICIHTYTGCSEYRHVPEASPSPRQ